MGSINPFNKYLCKPMNQRHIEMIWPNERDVFCSLLALKYLNLQCLCYLVICEGVRKRLLLRSYLQFPWKGQGFSREIMGRGTLQCVGANFQTSLWDRPVISFHLIVRGLFKFSDRASSVFNFCKNLLCFLDFQLNQAHGVYAIA